eukprot:2755270-Prymnesium_polylepis.1
MPLGTLKAICDLFTAHLGCTGANFPAIIRDAEMKCGLTTAGTGSLLERADAVCAIIEGCTAAEMVAAQTSSSGAGASSS